jgi:hypothetical protein
VFGTHSPFQQLSGSSLATCLALVKLARQSRANIVKGRLTDEASFRVNVYMSETSVAEELTDPTYEIIARFSICVKYKLISLIISNRRLKMNINFKLAHIPRTIGAKLSLLHKMQLQAEETFDNEEKTFQYDLTPEEFRFFELIQTLGSEFTKELIDIIDLLPPRVMCARTIEEAKEAINDAAHP